MGKRSEVLELAVLGLLHEGPRHGYELRKDLACRLGLPYAVSFGSLYPTLRCLLDRGLTERQGPCEDAARARVVYALTAAGRRHFDVRVSRPGPDAWEDGAFDVHFAFFARAAAPARLRVLEGRRACLQDRLERVVCALTGAGTDPPDRYRRELQRHGAECVERELRWLNRQIELELQDLHQSTPPRSN